MDELAPEVEQALRSALPQGCVHTDEITRIAFASDASLYWYIPRAVVFPCSIADIQQLFAWSRTHKIPLTFRAAGTSLSGQAVTEGVLVEVRRHWQRWEILDGGRRVRVQAGVRAGLINERLRPYWRRLGPDPASVEVCTVGGIVANNASGMCCGTRDTAYRTLESLVVVLPNGLVFDTGAAEADCLLWEKAPAIAEGLLRIRHHILNSPGLRERIRRKYQLKNTVGYSLNAFIDYDSPTHILAHLMVGSEGTLGFLAEIVLRTVPDPPLRLTGFALFPTPEEACSCVPALRELGADAVELLDAASLRALAGRPGVPISAEHCTPTSTALLFEYQRFTWSELEECQQQTAARLSSASLLAPVFFSSDGAPHLWAARRSLYPTVAARRPPGTTPISEDIAVPLEALPDTIHQLRRLFLQYGYPDAVIFGHAKDGNLHFVLPQPLTTAQDTERYAALMEEVVSLVLRYGGSLKAEHGTGRNMAPFVRAEWGEEAYELMWFLKRLIDPDGILNPDVILSRRERLHLQHLKPLPITHSELDRCMECGFCEPVCPSRDLTLTPRQRIVLLRHCDKTSHRLWQYALMDTCATDGLCQLQCPVGINTGDIIRALRQQQHSSLSHRLASGLARHFGAVDTLLRTLLHSGHAVSRLLGSHRLHRLTTYLHRWSRGTLPHWSPSLRHPLPRQRTTLPLKPGSALLFVSCPARWSGAPETLVLPSLAHHCGEELALFPDSHRFCCGLLFASKGFHPAAINALRQLQAEITRLQPRMVVVEGSSCAYWLKRHGTSEPAMLMDSTEYISHLLDHRPIARRRNCIALHIPCSARLMGIQEHMLRVAHACAEHVLTPPLPACCGAAGDLWLTHPELASRAIQSLQHYWYNDSTPTEGYSSNPPCEMALESLTHFPWRPLTALFVWATAPPAPQSPKV